MSDNFKDLFICDTFQKVIHITDTNDFSNGTGSLLRPNGVWLQEDSNAIWDSGSVYVYNDLGSNSNSIQVVNSTGLSILQEKIVKLNGHVDNIPSISIINNYEVNPIGILIRSISSNNIDFIHKRGILQTTFPTNTLNINDIIYCDNNGNLTSTVTPFAIGYVSDNLGSIYFDFINYIPQKLILEGFGPPSVAIATLPTQLYIDLQGTNGQNYTLWGWSNNDVDNIWKPFSTTILATGTNEEIIITEEIEISLTTLTSSVLNNSSLNEFTLNE